jgi:DNA-binding response OmpR family regulator
MSMTAPTVLIVEDDPALLRGLTDNFRLRGYQVRSAADGRSGLAQALAEPLDLLVLDVMLPQLNGYEVCQKLRLQKIPVPIIMLTAKGEEKDVVEGLDLGADDYMTKPFSIRELLARANALRRRHGAAEETVIQIGAAELDLASHKLTRDRREIPLTSKEFRLLEYFLSRRNRALTRSDIIDHVWGRSIIVSGRSVDRCIATLRSKIEPDASRPVFIRTVRDVGYRFELPG